MRGMSDKSKVSEKVITFVNFKNRLLLVISLYKVPLTSILKTLFSFIRIEKNIEAFLFKFSQKSKVPQNNV